MLTLEQKRAKQLENEIESLRKKLHDSVKLNEKNIQLKENEILEISKKLDELIIQYMSIK